jgi:enolase-phosphatase E1
MRAILLDIEGTTTPIRFIYEELFPYVRRHLHEYFDEHRDSSDLQSDVEMLRRESAGELPGAWDPIAYCLWLMDHDRKSTGLKSIQGKIWASGYQKGELKGEVFEDVPLALKLWSGKGVDVAIFSSGSVLAQKLLFTNSTAGNMSVYISRYFDTNTGSKTSPHSYERIASQMSRMPSDMLFVSDIASELDAAKTAGMECLLSVRPGNSPQPVSGYKVITSFSEIQC